MENRWAIVDKQDFKDIKTSREFLADIENTGEYFRISSILVELYNFGINVIDKYWTSEFDTIGLINPDKKMSQLLVNDLRFAPFNEITDSAYYSIFLSLLQMGGNDLGKILVSISENYSERDKTFPSYTKGSFIYQKVVGYVLQWFRNNINTIFEETPTFSNVNYVETIIKNLNDKEHFTEFYKKRYEYILSAAKRVSGQSTAAILALVYLQYASTIDYYSEKDVKNLYQSAYFSISNSEDLYADVYINASNAIESWQYGLIRLALFSIIKNRSSSYFTWNLQPEYMASENRQIKIIHVDCFFPSSNDLYQVNSTYLSHYEDV